MAVFLTEAFTAFLFENDKFVPFQVAQNFGAYRSTFNVGSTDGYIAVPINEMYGIEGNSITFIRCQPVDEDLMTFLNFKLLTGDGNNRKHVKNQ